LRQKNGFGWPPMRQILTGNSIMAYLSPGIQNLQLILLMPPAPSDWLPRMSQ
jgi:hypothetical protein